jgi:Ca2+-binding EF-hand superfamily protein
MKRSVLVSALTILAVAGTTVSVSAMGGGKTGMKGPRIEFSTLDSDGDGQVTQAEMQAHAAARFAAVDTNGDGALNAEELTARADSERAERMQRRVAKMIEKRDTNGDGQLSQEEMEAGKRGGDIFAKLDTNKDGALSQEEFDAGKKRFGKRHGGHGKKHTHGQQDDAGAQDQN